jgi:urea transport system substrate-binding protein
MNHPGSSLEATEVLRPGSQPPHGPAQVKETWVGRRLGKYLIIGTVGKGGMGIVYKARDALLKRFVAIKVLPGAVAAEPAALRRFLQEAQVAARLCHPNVVATHDVEERQGSYYIVMELVRGTNVQDLLCAKGAFPWPEATRIVADACRGLIAAHAAGLIHRDIKPANLIRAHDGVVKLADFGLAKVAGQASGFLTTAGDVLGTPQFMSPEQCHAEPLDERSDIYSLGATYYALLVGQPPFNAGQALQVMFAHCSNPVPDPREAFPDIPESCARLVRQAMAKKPAERFASAAAMLADLETILAEVAAGAAAEGPPRKRGESKLAALPKILPPPAAKAGPGRVPPEGSASPRNTLGRTEQASGARAVDSVQAIDIRASLGPRAPDPWKKPVRWALLVLIGVVIGMILGGGVVYLFKEGAPAGAGDTAAPAPAR